MNCIIQTTNLYKFLNLAMIECYITKTSYSAQTLKVFTFTFALAPYVHL